MLNFNTHAGFYHRKLSHEQVFKASPLPNGLKTKFAATVALMLLCCFSYQTVYAQCNPDITAPTAFCKGPFTIALNTNGNAPITPADIDNGSFDNCGAVTLAVSPSSVNCSNLGTVAVTLTVTDLAGNTNTCVTTVTVVDNLAPAIICPATYTFNTCPANTAPVVTGFASAIDNCGGNLAQKAYCTLPGNGITYCDVASGCTGNGIVRTWTATYAGLSSSCVQNIIVNDTQAPTVDWNGAGAGNPAPTSPLNLTCSDPVPVAAFPGAATFSDNCDVSLTTTVTDVSTKSANPALCAFYTYTITRTYKVQDDCGNMFTYVQTINVSDNTGPVITAPANYNVSAGPNCSTNVTFPAVTVSDNCAGNAYLSTSFDVINNITGLSVNSGTGLNPSGVYNAGAYTVFFSAADPCGKLGFASTTFNVVDNVAPTAICQAGTIQVSIPPTGTATLLASQVNNGSYDNCTPIGNLVLSLAGGTFNCNDVGGIFPDIVTLTVTDANGNTNTCSSTVAVVNNSAPAVFCKNLTVTLNAGGTVNVLASGHDNGSFDNCDGNGVLDFAYTQINGNPFGPSSNFTFTCANVGINTVRVRVREIDNGQIPTFTNDGFCNQTVTVIDNTAPVANCANTTVYLKQDGTYSLTPTNQTTLIGTTSDACGFTSSFSQTLFTCNDIDDGNPLNGPERKITITFTDPSGNTASCMPIVTVLDTINPVITCPDTVSVCLDANGIGKIVADSLINGAIYISSSNNGASNPSSSKYCVTAPNAMTISFDWNYHSNNSHAGFDPFGYSVNGTFHQLTNGASCTFNGATTQSGTATVTLSAGDAFCLEAQSCDNLFGQAEVWVTNFSETFSGAFAQNNWTKSFINSDGKAFFVDASIACGPNTYQISLDSVTWQGMDSLFCDSLDEYVDAWVRAIDDNGNISDTCQVKLHVEDKEPPIAACDEVTVSLNGLGQATVQAVTFDQGSIDNCTGPLTFKISKDEITYASSLTYNCSEIGQHPVTFQAIDGYGNIGYCVTFVVVQDNLPPVLTCPTNKTINCDQSSAPAATGFATATDNCAGTVTPTFTDTYGTIVSGAPPANYNTVDCRKITRRWESTDGSNTSICFQTITVQDLVAPAFDWNGASAGLGTAPTTPLAADVCAIPAAATPVGTDNCDTNVPVTFSIPVNTKGGNPTVCNFYTYTMTRRWFVADNCGNSTTYDQVVNVSDATAPVLSFPAMFMYNNNAGNCAGTANIDLLALIADCAAADQYLTVTYAIDGGAAVTNGTLNAVLSVGTHSVTVTAKDPCNNLSSTTFNIIIKDNESPTAICVNGPIQVTLNSNGIANITPANVNNGSNDNCGITSLNVNPASFDCFTTPNPHVVTLTVTDGAGNFNTCTTTVQIMNVSAPTIQCPAAITVSCSVFNPANPATSGGSATASTACGPVATTYTDVVASGSGNCKVINRTWSATTAGGTATCVQVITVQDNIQPTLVGVPVSTTVQACAVPAQAVVTATDNCATPVVTPAQTSTQGGNPALCSYYNYSITRTWTTTDGCTSPVVGTQTLTVVDNTAPIMAVPNPLIISTDANKCEANLNVNLLNYISDCAADPYLTLTNNAVSGNGTNLITGVYQAGDYNVTVTATDPCGNVASQTFVLRIADGQTPVAKCFSEITVVLDNTGNATITANDVNDNSYDNCGIASITLSDYNFTTADAGMTIPVVMTVTDFAGNSNDCTVLVHVVDDVTFIVNDVTAGTGEMKLIPVTVDLFDDIVSFEMDIDIANTGVATVVDVVDINPSLSGLIKTVTAPGHYHVSWIDNTVPFGVDLTDGSLAFNLKVMVVGAIGTSTDVNISNLEVGQMIAGIPTVVPSLGITGTLTVVNLATSFTLAGDLFERPDCGNDLVLQSNVDYTGTISGTLSNVPGTYSVAVPLGSNETLTPSKNINNANGVTALDAFTAHQYAAGLPIVPALTPYQIIAADANGSNSVTSFDAFLIQQLSAGFPVSIPKSWRFVPTATVLPANPFSAPFSESISHNNISADHLNDDFYGVKVGDVVGCNANPANFNGGTTADGNSSNVVLHVQDQPISAGSDVYMTFKAKDFKQMVTCQTTLNFDAQVLQYQSVVAGNVPNLSASNFNPMLANEGMLATSWYNLSPVSLDNGQEMFTLKFTALKDAASLSDLVWVSADFVPVEAVASNGTMGGVEVVFDGTVSGTEEGAGSHFALHQNRPNPFSTQTTIGFNLPQADHATLIITDASGKTLKTLEGNFTAGFNQFKIERKDLPATGVYFYQLKTADFHAVKKMILVD